VWVAWESSRTYCTQPTGHAGPCNFCLSGERANYAIHDLRSRNSTLTAALAEVTREREADRIAFLDDIAKRASDYDAIEEGLLWANRQLESSLSTATARLAKLERVAEKARDLVESLYQYDGFESLQVGPEEVNTLRAALSEPKKGTP
jgi:hypothetical protein